MMFRLVVLAFLIGLAVMALRRWSKRLAASGVGDLSASELAEVKALAGRVKHIADALQIRSKVQEILLDDKTRGAELAADVGQQIDRAIWQLTRQHTTMERIQAAVAAIDLDALADAETRANVALEAAQEPDARSDAQRTLERVTLQRTQLEQLAKRQRELESGGAQIVLDLQNLHLALLDAASSRAGIGAEPVRTLREKLAEATRSVATSTQAEEEIDRAMAAQAASERA